MLNKAREWIDSFLEPSETPLAVFEVQGREYAFLRVETPSTVHYDVISEDGYRTTAISRQLPDVVEQLIFIASLYNRTDKLLNRIQKHSEKESEEIIDVEYSVQE